jgi:beta-hydroxylase
VAMHDVLAAAIEPKFLALHSFLGCVLFVHFRGKVRHRFTRQLTDHSTFLAPINCVLYLFSAVPNRPFPPRERLVELDTLRANWRVFRDEGRVLLEAGHIKGSDRHNDLGFNSFFRKGWTRFYLKWYDDPLPSARALCPRSVEILKSVPSVHGAMFAVLPPGGKLMAHRDPFAGSLRYHLGLITPNDDRCRIYVDGNVYSWRDGQDVVFDETFIHNAFNDTDQHRLILFCDVERPLHTRLGRAINRFLCHYVVSATQTRNAEGDKVGFANRLFKYIYMYRRVNKAFKRYNRRAYYAVKYVSIAGVLTWIFI